MRSVKSIKSRSKRLQRGGAQTMNMTIKEWSDTLYKIHNNKDDNTYFGKQYIFISNVIDDKYADMQDTYIISIRNVTQDQQINMQDVSKIGSQLKKFGKNETIQITYDHIIKKNDGTEINLKNDLVYIRIKDLVRDKIAEFLRRRPTLPRVLMIASPYVSASDEDEDGYPSMSASDQGEVEYPPYGGKRSRKRRRKTRRRKSRKY